MVQRLDGHKAPTYQAIVSLGVVNCSGSILGHSVRRDASTTYPQHRSAANTESVKQVIFGWEGGVLSEVRCVKYNIRCRWEVRIFEWRYICRIIVIYVGLHTIYIYKICVAASPL